MPRWCRLNGESISTLFQKEQEDFITKSSPSHFVRKIRPAWCGLTSSTASARPGCLQKLYYIGPQFRRERPQKGRYRQFSQIGAEVIGPPSAGSESPLRDAEVLEMLATLLDELGIQGWTLALEFGWLGGGSRAL